MTSITKKLGVVVAVEGDIATVGMYEMSNESSYIWNGEVLSGPKVGAFLTIHQNNISLIASVSSEGVMDQQNTIRSNEFDNRYSKNSINRVVKLKTQGVIRDSGFSVTSEFVPMIGNEVSVTTNRELSIIYGLKRKSASIRIGKSILDGQPVKIPINAFFASHIGVFGNTGSGKSNTLHKLFLELFRSRYRSGILQKSQFFVIDFNGEYVDQNIFGVPHENKAVFHLNTRKKYQSERLPVSSEYLFDADILSILFDARPTTQVPFLRKTITLFNQLNVQTNLNMGQFFVGIVAKILVTGNSTSDDALSNWTEKANKYLGKNTRILNDLNSVKKNSSTGSYYFTDGKETTYFNSASVLTDDQKSLLRINEIERQLSDYYLNKKTCPLEQLKMFLDFELVFETSWGGTKAEYLRPLFARIESALRSLDEVLEVCEDPYTRFRALNIISLVNTNLEVKRVAPMLLSKMIYDHQKNRASGLQRDGTVHLIIDEAHNILNNMNTEIGDDWRDYRLSVFEEIVKEGRKFDFFLTLASQRPADISPTILSQLHNYFVHRLVNEKDLIAVANTMPTIDRTSFQRLPSLGKGEAIVSGVAVQIPILVKIDLEPTIHPSSDDIVLTDLWGRSV